MPVISMMRMSGDPDDLADRVRTHVAPVAARLAPRHGALANFVVRQDDGILTINVWADEEGRHAMAAEPEIQEAVRAAGLPQPAFESHEILAQHFNAEAIAAL